jgi:hypothetical protein
MTGPQRLSDTPVSKPFPGSDMVFTHHGDGVSDRATAPDLPNRSWVVRM